MTRFRQSVSPAWRRQAGRKSSDSHTPCRSYGLSTTRPASRHMAVSSQEDGVVLPIVLILLAVGVLMLAPTLGQGFSSLRGATVTEDRAEELYAADSGIEEALHWLIGGKPDNGLWTWDSETETGTREPYTLNDASVEVTVQPAPDIGSNYHRITSVATGPEGSTTVLAQVWASAPPLEDLGDLGQGTWEGDAYIEGDGDLHGTVDGNVVVIGDLTLKDNDAEVGGDVTVTGDFTLNSWSMVIGNVCAGGNVTLKAYSGIQGDLCLRLDPDESALVELKGQSDLGDIYVLTESGATAAVTIELSNKDEIGDIYVASNVTLTTQFHSGATHGTIYEDWDETSPPPPTCTGVPIGGGAITTYEIA